MIPGSHPRRTILKAGLGGFASLSLADVLRLQNQSQASESRTAASERTAVILVWLRGGASHLETFDPKPQAASEFRGPFSPIDTNVPGIQICELLPRLSTIADKYSILRSIAHTGGGHPAGSLQVLAGDPDPADKLVPVLPDWMSIASYLRRDSVRSLPNYIAVNPVDNYDSLRSLVRLIWDRRIGRSPWLVISAIRILKCRTSACQPRISTDCNVACP